MLIDISSIVDKLPDILIYFVPGYLGLSFFVSVSRQKFGEAEKLILSCAISFVVVSVMRLILSLPIYAELCISIFVCLLGGYGFSRIYQSKWFRRFLTDKLSFSFAQSAWEDVIDYEVGSIIRVKYKGSNKIVVGIIESVGFVPDDPWIAISHYDVYQGVNDDDPYSPGANIYFMININDIEYAEVYPNKATEGDNN